MKTTIYYFTGTGNSLYAAKLLKTQLLECDIVPIAKIWQNSEIYNSSEYIILTFPIYAFGAPQIVLEFLKKVELKRAKHIFAAATQGGKLSGCAMHEINKVLKERGRELTGGFYIQMPGNSVDMGKVLSREKQEELFTEAKNRIKGIALQIKNHAKLGLNENNFFGPILAFLRKKVFLNNVKTMDKKFYATDKCTSCGLCDKVCPVYNIKIAEEGKPKWLHDCQQCNACINLCPEKAIQTSKKTEKKGRYKNPHITIEEISSQRELY